MIRLAEYHAGLLLAVMLLGTTTSGEIRAQTMDDKIYTYVGYTHDWAFGETADLTGDPNRGAFVFRVRIWR